MNEERLRVHHLVETQIETELERAVRFAPIRNVTRKNIVKDLTQLSKHWSLLQVFDVQNRKN